MAQFGPDDSVCVRIRKDDFHDAIYFSPDEFEQLKDSALEDLKNQRYQDYLEFLQDSKNRPPIVYTKAQIQESLDIVIRQKAELEQKLAEAPNIPSGDIPVDPNIDVKG